jgi:hypothetical protein
MEHGPEIQPPNETNGDENNKITRKIEVIPVEDFWSGPVEYDEDMFGEAESFADSESQKEEQLPYIPFDPKKELRNIRGFVLEDLDSAPDYKRQVHSERLTSFKENLLHQKEGIANTIERLHNTVEHTPDQTTEELMQIVLDSAPDYKFTQDQISIFKFAIEQYQEKHAAVEKYRAMYPSDIILFEACFGKKPKGKVEVIKGPMTLCFRCFDRDDYAYVNTFYKHRGDETKIQPEDISRASDSAGVALSSVKIEELAGVVTAENVGNNDPTYELIKGVEKSEEIHRKDFELFLDSQKGDIDIEVKGGGVWKLKVIEHNDRGEPLRLQFLDLNDLNSEPIFDVVRVEATTDMEKHGNYIGVLRNIENGELSYNLIKNLKKGKLYGWIDINKSFFKITDHSPEGTIVKYREDEFTMVSNDEASKSTHIHEDQHQFNKLFQPIEMREDIWTMMRRAVVSSSSPEEAVQKLIHGYVRLERKWMGFDSRARDEILAHLKEGRDPEAILDSLLKFKGYDYVEIFKSKIEQIPESVKAQLQKEVSEVFYKKVDGDDMAINAQALEIEDSDVQSHIDSVFKDEYKDDLKEWLDSVSVLEKKGYSRSEVVALLYQEPINSWSNLSRRIKPKQKTL